MTDRKLIAVTAPDVDGLPEYLTVGKRYKVFPIYGAKYIVNDKGSNQFFGGILPNGADWIPHYEGDVIQGFGEYRTYNGNKAIVEGYDGSIEHPWFGNVNGKWRWWNSDGTCGDRLDIIGLWEEASEADDDADTALKAPQPGDEIPRMKPVKRFAVDGPGPYVTRNGALLIVTTHQVNPKARGRSIAGWLCVDGEWKLYSWYYPGCQDHMRRSRPNDIVAKAKITDFESIPTPETFTKEEALDKMLEGKSVQDIETKTRYFFNRNTGCVMTIEGDRDCWSTSKVPNYQLFIKVPS